MSEHLPLVSLAIITYNSSDYILETLESAKAQTYRNLELIISDDCSKDNTVELCKNWVEKNQMRFVRVEIVTMDRNTGVSANLNRAIAACKGEWIKGLAGDDLYLPDCVEQFMDHIRTHPDVSVLFSLIQSFRKNSSGLIYENELPLKENRAFFDLESKDQLRHLYNSCYPFAPGLFIKSEIAKSIQYDERYKGLEDYPYWINLTQQGIRLCLMEKVTILYRHHDSLSICYKNFYNPVFQISLFQFYDSIKEETKWFYPDIVKRRNMDMIMFYLTMNYVGNERTFIRRAMRFLLRSVFMKNAHFRCILLRKARNWILSNSIY